MPAIEQLTVPAGSVWIRGGDDAPTRARSYVLSRLDDDISASRAAEAALIASELVTNSVIHAHVGSRQALFLEVGARGDEVQIAVTDAGSESEPRMRADDPAVPGGFGLRLVDYLSSAWGVDREPGGTTRVWCQLPIGRVGS